METKKTGQKKTSEDKISQEQIESGEFYFKGKKYFIRPPKTIREEMIIQDFVGLMEKGSIEERVDSKIWFLEYFLKNLTFISNGSKEGLTQSEIDSVNEDILSFDAFVGFGLLVFKNHLEKKTTDDQTREFLERMGNTFQESN